MSSSAALTIVSSRIVPSTVHIVERMAPGGIETLVLDMAHGMAGQHTVFSLGGTRDELIAAWPRLTDLDGTLEVFGRQPGVRPALVARLARRLTALRPSAVILHHDGPLIYGGLAARLAGVPVLVHVEHDAWHYNTPWRRAVARLAFHAVRPRRVAVSPDIAQSVGRFVGGIAAAIIPPGIDIVAYRPRDRAQARARLGMPLDVPVIGTSGRLVAVKSQGTLIDALALLHASTALRPHLVIAGEGPERAALVSRAAAHDLAEFVHLPGHRDDLSEVLSAFDVYALPSLNEGLPRGVLEAQAAGVPVVASHVGGLAEAVCPRSGRLVPAGDAHALADALAAVLAEPADPSVPRAFVEARYALSGTLDAYARVIDSEGRLSW